MRFTAVYKYLPGVKWAETLSWHSLSSSSSRTGRSHEEELKLRHIGIVRRLSSSGTADILLAT